MRRVVISLSIVAFMLWMTAGPAFAASPHFISASASVDSSGNLVATFKEAGLGTTVSTETINLSADSTAI